MAAASPTTAKKRKKPGVDLHRWGTAKGRWRLLAVIAKAKESGTLTAMSPHYGCAVSEAEAEALVRLKAERERIAEVEERLQALLETGRLTEEERIEKRREKHRARYRDLRSQAETDRAEDFAEELAEDEWLDELAEVMQAA